MRLLASVGPLVPGCVGVVPELLGEERKNDPSNKRRRLCALAKPNLLQYSGLCCDTVCLYGAAPARRDCGTASRSTRRRTPAPRLPGSIAPRRTTHQMCNRYLRRWHMFGPSSRHARPRHGHGGGLGGGLPRPLFVFGSDPGTSGSTGDRPRLRIQHGACFSCR